MMNEEVMNLFDCKPGDRISREVVDIRTGAILCRAGHILTEESIEWLKRFLCSDIYISKDLRENSWHLEEEVIETYEESKGSVGELLQDLKDSNALDSKKIKDVQQHFHTRLNASSTIMGCINIIKDLDEYIYAHSMNVGMLSALIGRWLKLDESQLEDLFLAGVLHDSGKYRIEPKVMNKRGPLTQREFDLVKKHVTYGYDLIKDSGDITAAVKVGVLTHHERIDGSGYPRELKGDEIPLFGKIIAVADVYDAMISKRVYKNRQTPFEVMQIMSKEGIGKLDTDVLLTFLHNVANFYLGVYVRLSTDVIGEIVFIHPHCVYRPIVKVEDTYIDLDTHKHIKIVDII